MTSFPLAPFTDPCIGLGVGVSADIRAVLNVKFFDPSLVYFLLSDTIMN